MAERQGSAPIYDVIAERDVMVPMRDGVRLATDLYFPAMADRSPGLFPCSSSGRPTTSRPRRGEDGKFFARHGYVCAIQDVRDASPPRESGTPSRERGRTASTRSSGSARSPGRTVKSERWAPPTPGAISTRSPT